MRLKISLWMLLPPPMAVAMVGMNRGNTAGNSIAFVPSTLKCSFRHVGGGLLQREDGISSPFCSLLSPSTTTMLYGTSTESPEKSETALDKDAETNMVVNNILNEMQHATKSSFEWSESFGLNGEEAAFYALFSSIRSLSNDVLGINGKPFYLAQDQIVKAIKKGSGEESASTIAGYFTFDDLAKALEEDFLDADRGSTDNKKGWKVTAVSTPRGSSFEDARMTLEEVEAALSKGTVIFSAIGAHVPKLARATLACTDASALPNALNMYVTAAGKRTSAPPHTDRQDVIVAQTQGRKHWRVYSPPDPTLRPQADAFARGKGDDNLPLHQLENMGCKLLVDAVLNPGDVLFIPAGFPHTTDTIASSSEEEKEDTSIHLTFNFDSHVWDLDYLSVRRLALRRACVKDEALGVGTDDNRYVGKANLLPSNVRNELFHALPLGLLDDLLDEATRSTLMEEALSEVQRISMAVDESTASAVDANVWKETLEQVQKQGMELFDVHRDMYLAAIEEGRLREQEAAMTSHLEKEARRITMTPERMQRLSLFRVRSFYERISEAKKSLVDWSYEGVAQTSGEGGEGGNSNDLPENWAFTMSLSVGDEVEADLGGAFFPAKVTRVAGSKYDVQFFDGDRGDGLERDMIKLLRPPAIASDEDDFDTTGLTKKEIKKLRKKMEKKKNK
mmetsp:Transcript_42359/g.61877  ORF Transcript_42359/g.61877 Transcript_42359/m.61877 type:complete len:676 (+) Transcript_42359:203-2230(+)